MVSPVAPTLAETRMKKDTGQAPPHDWPLSHLFLYRTWNKKVCQAENSDKKARFS